MSLVSSYGYWLIAVALEDGTTGQVGVFGALLTETPIAPRLFTFGKRSGRVPVGKVGLKFPQVDARAFPTTVLAKKVVYRWLRSRHHGCAWYRHPPRSDR
jgi:hypothetical protein